MGEASMKHRGFFLLALVLCVTTPALAQSARDLEADRLADKDPQEGTCDRTSFALSN